MSEHKDHPDDQALSAYLDGELPPDEADRLSERLAAEPALARRLEQMRAADTAARQAFAAIDTLPMPQGVLDLLNGTDTIRDRRQPAADNIVPFPLRMMQPFFQVPVAIAASLALAAGFFVNGQLQPDPSPGSGLYASAVPAGSDLHRILESGVGAVPQSLPGGTTGELLLTFEDTDGDYCRQVRLDDAASSIQAVACRRGDRWHMEVASFGAPAGTSPDGQYQQASSGSSAAVNAAIDDLIGDNTPLDAEAETRLVESGWKKTE